MEGLKRIDQATLDNIATFNTQEQGQKLIKDLEKILQNNPSNKIQEMANNLKRWIITIIEWSNKSDTFHREKNRSHSVNCSWKEQMKQYTELTNNLVEKYHKNKKLNIKM